MTKKTYYLEDTNKFFEITIDDRRTAIRVGKKGLKGRTYPAKQHPTAQKAKQFALELVNSRIIQGYENTSNKIQTKEVCNPTRKKGEALMRSASIKRSWRKPPKKRDSIRRLWRQSTLLLAENTANATPSVLNDQLTSALSAKSSKPERKWRKPHKKQSTIRRMVKRASFTQSGSLRKRLFDQDMT